MNSIQLQFYTDTKTTLVIIDFHQIKFVKQSET